MTGGPICFKHLEQMRVKELEDLKLPEVREGKDGDEEAEKLLGKFYDGLKDDLSVMVLQLQKIGIKIGSVVSEGKNPKTFYYIIETPKNLKRIRKYLGV